MKHKIAAPRIAAATILVNADLTKVLWARRNPELKFLGGFHGFTGGKLDESDPETEVRNCSNAEMKSLIACAARETFEEIGVLLVRNGDKLTQGQRKSLHDDLISGRSTFAEILELWGLWIDAEDFTHTGFWTTPEFSPMRFKTHFFIAVCPPRQTPYRAITELQEIEFIDAREALEMWSRSKVLIAPPILISLKELAKSTNVQRASKRLLQRSRAAEGNINYIELNSRLVCVPLRTNTLPPATHTNCFIVGKKDFVIIDAATPFSDEQEKLFTIIDDFVERGYNCREIIVSHLHPDHFGGEMALKNHLKRKFNLDVPISAHKITGESLDGKVNFEHFIEDGHTYQLKNCDEETFAFTTIHTPGHARGHLCFYDSEFGFLLSSDNVVGMGTVVIAPPEGDMSIYLDSLKRMKNLPNLNFLCGSHGAAVYNAPGKIDAYIEHRLEREEQILQTVRQGFKTPSEIVKKVYGGLNSNLIPLAEKSVEAHLEKLVDDEKILLAAKN